MANTGMISTENSKEELLLALTTRTGYTIIQENGQRRYGGPPPNWTGPSPPKGSEVFVGKIPRDCFEDELVPVFETIGEIYELRLMMDFSGSNRGYGFVMFKNVNDAKEAIKVMNNYEIRKGRYLGVCKSVDNCRLFVGGIPKNKAREEVLEEMKKISEGVVDVILYSSVIDKSKSRGFAFVEYENHRSAAMARRKLIPGRIELWNQEIAVDWAEPEPDIDEDIMKKVTILYVRNIMLKTTEDQLRQEFSLNGSLVVEKVKKLRDFAFVHYKCREDADQAKQHFHRKVIDGSEIEVTWAKPVERSKTRNSAAPFSRYLIDPGYGQFLGSYPSSQTFDISSPPSFTFPTPSPFPMAGRVPLINPRSLRGRGRGAAGLRGQPGLGRSSYRKPTDMNMYDLQPNMHLIPTNYYTVKAGKPLTQILQEVAQKNNWGEPSYQLHSTVNPESNNRDQMPLFLSKVSFPNIPTVFSPTKLTHDVESAKNIAADHVLLQLGIPTGGYEQPIYEHGAPLTMIPTVGIY